MERKSRFEIGQVLVDTEELDHRQNEQDAPLAWFGAQPPPRPNCLAVDDPTLPRSFLRTPSSVSTEGDDGKSNSNGDTDNVGEEDGGEADGGRRDGQASSGGLGRDVAEPCVRGIAAAGVGAAHVLTGPGRLEDGAWEEASSACPGMRSAE